MNSINFVQVVWFQSHKFSGLNGNAGMKGDDGLSGEALLGRKGVPGYPGEQGLTGARGIQGKKVWICSILTYNEDFKS